MKIKHLIDKIKNIEIHDVIIFLSGITTIFISLVNFLGYLFINFETILQIIIGVSGIILLSQFSLNRKINNSLSMTASGNLTIDYPTEYSENIDKCMENSIDVSIYGIELYRDTDKYYQLLEILTKRNIKIRVLLADPEGDVINMVKLRYPNEDTSAAESIKKTISLLRKLENSTVEIRKINYLFPRKAYFFDLDDDKSVVFISNYTFRLANEKSKYVFYKGQSNYYTFFKKEFDLMWDSAKKVT